MSTPFDLNELTSPKGPLDESCWEMVQKQFVIPSGRMMLNAANLCPSPHFVNERVAAYTGDLAGDVSFQSRAKFGEGRTKAIGELAAYLKAPLKTIGITRNTSESNNIVVNGLDLNPQDEVLIWEKTTKSIIFPGSSGQSDMVSR